MKYIYLPVIIFISLSIQVCAQGEIYSKDCGPESLMYVLEQFNKDASASEVMMLTGYNPTNGTTMLGLKSAAEKLGLPVVSVKLTENQLKSLNYPVIVFVDANHYIVIDGRNWFGFGGKFKIFDTLSSKKELKISSLANRWDGSSLVFSSEFKQRIDKKEKAGLFQNKSGPYICFDDSVAFEGTIDAGDIAKHTFEFVNLGTDTLRLYIRSSCSCTTTKYDKLIPPGGNGEIELEFDTIGKLGQSQQSLDVQTNDPRNPWVKLTLIVNVQDVVKVYPPKIYYDIIVNESIKNVIKVLDGGNGFTEISKIETTQGIQAKVLPSRSDTVLGRYIPIEFVYRASSVPKEINENITIILTNGKELRVPIQGKVIGNINANPPAAVFGNVKKNTSMAKEIELSSEDDSKIRVSHAESTSQNVKVNVLDNIGLGQRIIITYNSNNNKISEQSEVKVYFQGETYPALSIPVYADVVK